MFRYVKEFIEKNIDLIESQDWKQVFYNWYNEAEQIWPDVNEVDEMLNILTSVNADLTARESVLTDEIVKILTKEQKKHKGMSHPRHIKHFPYRLHSHLGYTYEEVLELIKKVGISMGLKYTDDYGGGFLF